MLLILWDAIEAYFKDKAYWALVRPVFGFVSIYLAALVTVYEYVQWQYQVSPSLALFVRSYLFWQVSIGFGALGVLLLVFRSRRPPGDEGPPARWLRLWRAVGVKRLVLAAVIVTIAFAALVALEPARARHVRVRFLSDPGRAFDRNAFVYLLYELNRLQRHWYFVVDFDTFDPLELATADRAACQGRPVCYARHLAGTGPFIGITTEPLGANSFWENDGSVSVITTHEWETLAPPSIYEYLVHAVIVESIVIHLNAQCAGLPEGAGDVKREGRGGLLEFAPRRQAMKAEIMAAHLTPDDEELLLNCLGVEYMTTCASLLSLEWIHSRRVEENLQRAYGVTLRGAP